MAAPITGISKQALETSDAGWRKIFSKFAKRQTRKRASRISHDRSDSVLVVNMTEKEWNKLKNQKVDKRAVKKGLKYLKKHIKD